MAAFQFILQSALSFLLFLSPANGKSVVDPKKLSMDDKQHKESYLEMNLGKEYYEGDIILTSRQRDAIAMLQGNGSLEARALMKDVQNLWPDGVVPYVIADDLRTESLGYIHSALAEWESKTCIKFTERDNEEDYIEYLYDGDCHSQVGRTGGRQEISVGADDGSLTCGHGNLVHQTAHALGFFHEHTRPDRDNYVEIKLENVAPGYEKYFDKGTEETIDSKGVEYDYNSVMHFGKYFYAKEPGLETIHPLEEGATIGQRIGLSELDVKQATLLYKCDERKDHHQAHTADSEPNIEHQQRKHKVRVKANGHKKPKVEADKEKAHNRKQ